MRKNNSGFTIVEILIVIAMIAILATIIVVAYNGTQQCARDSVRKSDIHAITAALENYYTINGKYPTSSGSTTINGGWSTTADASWQNLVNQLVPTYSSSLPKDPSSSAGSPGIYGGSAYDYMQIYSLCGASGDDQGYILAYHLEGSPQVNNLIGGCTGSPVGPYASASNFRVVK